MKQINYSGSSKLISKIVYLLNRKAPLPLDGDGDPSWGANGQVLTTDGTGATYWSAGGGSGDSVTWTQTQASGTKIAEIDINGVSQNVYAPEGGSGGHVIEDTNGTALTQRADLQFVGVYTEDDSANDRTKVNVVRTMTKAQMDALSAAEKVGFIRTSDEADNPYVGTPQKIAEVSANQTYAAQLTALQTAFSALSASQKLRSFLVFHGGYIARYSNSMYDLHTCFEVPSTGFVATQISITNAKFRTYNGSTTFDGSSSTDASPMELWIQ